MRPRSPATARFLSGNREGAFRIAIKIVGQDDLFKAASAPAQEALPCIVRELNFADLSSFSHRIETMDAKSRLQIYCRLMTEIRIRKEAMDAFAGGNAIRVPDFIVEESCWL